MAQVEAHICPKCGNPYDVRKVNWWAKNSKGTKYEYDGYGHRIGDKRSRLMKWCRVKKNVLASDTQPNQALDRSNTNLIDSQKFMELFKKDVTISQHKIFYRHENLDNVNKGSIETCIEKIIKSLS